MLTQIVSVFTCLVLSCHGQTGYTYWDSLYTTFGYYYSVPITLNEAVSDGWDKIFSCDDNEAVGNVYAQDGDISSMPIYNIDGNIAGIILGVLNPGASSEIAPFKRYTMTNGTVFWGIEANFRDPTATCDAGNSANSNGTVGDRLWFAHGNDGTYFGAPLTEDAATLEYEGWDIGKCFIFMGQHYWRYISPDMDCDNFYPIFLLYTRGKLNAWGAALGHSDTPYLTSKRWEHPQGDEIHYFFKDDDFPECVLNATNLSTQHIYMSNWFWNNCL